MTESTAAQACRLRVPVATAKALEALGRQVAARLSATAVVLLEGALGAGKTTFAQGVARGLGVRGPVVSPTYALVHEYEEGCFPLRHADVYRIERAEELQALNLDERVGVDGVWLVEWASRFPEVWPAERLEVRIEIVEDARVVWFTARGPNAQLWIDGLGDSCDHA